MVMSMTVGLAGIACLPNLGMTGVLNLETDSMTIQMCNQLVLNVESACLHHFELASTHQDDCR